MSYIDRAELLHAFLSQYYLAGDHFDPPNTVLVSDYNDDFAILQSALERACRSKNTLSKAFRGQRARWVGLAADNAAVGCRPVAPRVVKPMLALRIYKMLCLCQRRQGGLSALT